MLCVILLFLSFMSKTKLNADKAMKRLVIEQLWGGGGSVSSGKNLYIVRDA